MAAYAAALPAIEDELAALPKPDAAGKVVFVIHMPPSGLGLDVLRSGEKVGSQAVAGFIKKTQPLLALHGHIHESPEKSGHWSVKIGKSMCVQPGQAGSGTLIYVLIDLAGAGMERFMVPV